MVPLKIHLDDHWSTFCLAFKGLHYLIPSNGDSQVALVVKNLLTNAGDVRYKDSIPGLGSSPGGGHGNPLSNLAWEIPWTEEPGGPQSIGSQRVRHNRGDLAYMPRRYSTSFPTVSDLQEVISLLPKNSTSCFPSHPLVLASARKKPNPSDSPDHNSSKQTKISGSIEILHKPSNFPSQLQMT